MKKIIHVAAIGMVAGMWAMPQGVYAAFEGIKGLIRETHNIINTLIGIAVACAVLAFFWGLAQYILHADDADERKESRQFMIWGIVALFVMTSVWGLVAFLDDAFLGGGGSRVDFDYTQNNSGLFGPSQQI